MSTQIKRGTILIVEDDEDIRLAIAELLSDEGFKVAVAANGSEGLKAIAQLEPPCLVLLDLMMPVMSGEDFLQHLRKSPSLSRIPVIIVTASGRTLLPGAQGILKKPFEVGELFAAIEAYCP